MQYGCHMYLQIICKRPAGARRSRSKVETGGEYIFDRRALEIRRIKIKITRQYPNTLPPAVPIVWTMFNVYTYIII